VNTTILRPHPVLGAVEAMRLKKDQESAKSLQKRLEKNPETCNKSESSLNWCVRLCERTAGSRFLRPPRGATVNYGTKAWFGLAAYVAAAELLAPDDQLLSDQVGRWMQTPLGRVLCACVVAETGGHLLHILSPRADAYHHLGRLFLRLSNQTDGKR